MGYLTSRSQISAITADDLFHIVDVNDTSQNPAGSSYKGSVQQLIDVFDGNYVHISGDTMTGPLIVPTISATTISGGTLYGDGSNLTGISGSIFTGGTVTGPTVFTNGLTANTISATTYLNLPIDVYVTGGTYSNGIATFTNITGGTFNVSGFYSGDTDIYISAFTYSNNTFTLDRSSGSSFYATINDVTGLTVNGDLTITGTTYTNTISATTYQNLPGSSTGNCFTDFYVTNIHGCSPITIYDSTQTVGSTASGTLSFAFGKNVTASGNGSHAEGSGTTASGDYSHAEGFGTLASGNYSKTYGYKTSATTSYATASGYETTASGYYSTASGYKTIASGNWSFAIGNSSTANGQGAHAEGQLTTANGNDSHSEGYQTTANGQSAHAEGSGTIASGQASHTEGSGTTALGAYSHAEGVGTISNADFQHVSGKFNLTASTQGAFIIGNGTDNLNRSNLVFAGDNDFYIYGNLQSTTISATTYQNLPTDIYVSAFTYSNNTFTLDRSSGSSLTATINEVTGLTVNGVLSATTIIGNISSSIYRSQILTGGTSYTFNDFSSVNLLSINKLTGSSTTVILNQTPNIDEFYVVKDRKGDSSIYPIIISGGTYNIDGYPSVTINLSKTSLTFLFDGEEYIII